MQVTFLSLAVWDLAAVRATIAADDPVAAQRVGQRLSQVIARLATMPNLGKPGRVFNTRELVTPKIGKTAYVVVYRVREQQVQILRVLPGMRDLEQILQQDFPEEGN
ncbi:MAG TPA: type II toxin-antitoxin system RelE/ParE family toxin [Thermosynechococcaceae cyanobacterium]|jgi:toxin ParE1/3/4